MRRGRCERPFAVATLDSFGRLLGPGQSSSPLVRGRRCRHERRRRARGWLTPRLPRVFFAASKVSARCVGAPSAPARMEYSPTWIHVSRFGSPVLALVLTQARRAVQRKHHSNVSGMHGWRGRGGGPGGGGGGGGGPRASWRGRGPGSGLSRRVATLQRECAAFPARPRPPLDSRSSTSSRLRRVTPQPRALVADEAKPALASFGPCALAIARGNHGR